ncbi:MAG TPA: hypothetical protein VGG83_24370 [Trebonia sp.]|nr:hypothetical protein [Trebonia sp.]
MRKVVVAVLAAVLVAGGAAVAVWRVDAAGGLSASTVASVQSAPVVHAISCASATSCLSVGASVDAATGALVPVAHLVDDGARQTVPVTSPGPAGMPSSLTGVSCRTAHYCLAVGQYNTASYGDPLPYAMAWNGTSLSAVAQMPFPPGAYLDAIGGVSCPAVNRCVVMGLATGDGSPSSFGDADLVWTWNGRTWSMTVVPSPAKTDMENFSSIHCTSLTQCMAAGQQIIDSNGNTLPMFDKWNGTSFMPLYPTLPAGMIYGGFTGISCIARNHCAAVGTGYGPTMAPITSFLDVWNGRKWSYTPWVSDTGLGNAQLSGVSCTSVSYCVAVGVEGQLADQQAATLVWNGDTWAADAESPSASGQTTLFDAVSCSSSGVCTATGLETSGVAATQPTPVVGQWNGVDWQTAAP